MRKPNENDKRLNLILQRILGLNDQVLLLVHDRPDLLARFLNQRVGVLQVLAALQRGTPTPPEALGAFERIAEQLETIVLRANQIQDAPKMDA